MQQQVQQHIGVEAVTSKKLPVPLYKFDASMGAFVIHSTSSSSQQNEATSMQQAATPLQQPLTMLKLLSWNCWYRAQFQRERANLLAQYVISESKQGMSKASSNTTATVPVLYTGYNIICLQEATPDLLYTMVSKYKELREDYVFTSPPSMQQPHGSYILPYGCCMLIHKSLYHLIDTVYALTLPSDMGRFTMILELTTQPKLVISTVHVESGRSAHLRSLQIKAMGNYFEETMKDSTVILCGDFNFDSTVNFSRPGILVKPLPHLENDNLQNYMPSFLDVWPSLHPDDPGYTFDSETNECLLFSKHLPERMRYDRMLIKQQQQQQQDKQAADMWKCTKLDIMGNSKRKNSVVPSAFNTITVSDHYGLRAEFILVNQENSVQDK